jgi:hypothetical protein
MLQFIFANLLMVSLGTILYLFARSLPRLQEEHAEKSASLLERLVTSDIPHKFDRAVSLWAGKAFRRMKILSMRFDNYLTDKLKKINTAVEGGASGLTGQSKPKIDLGNMIETKPGEYSGPERRRDRITEGE